MPAGKKGRDEMHVLFEKREKVTSNKKGLSSSVGLRRLHTARASAELN